MADADSSEGDQVCAVGTVSVGGHSAKVSAVVCRRLAASRVVTGPVKG